MPSRPSRYARSTPALLLAGAGACLVLAACADAEPTAESPATVVAEPAAGANEVESAASLDRPILTMWARGGLPENVPSLAGAVPGVIHAAAVRQDTLGLVGSRTADGEAVDDLADGWRFPVAGAAINPETWSTLVESHATRARVGLLRPGAVLLSEGFATPRGLAAGSTVDLAGAPNLVVVGVLPAGTVGDAEVILHEADAETAGIVRGPTLVVEHDATDAAGRGRVAAALGALVPKDLAARVVDAQDPDVRGDAPLVLSLAQVKATFGEFAYRVRDGRREIDADPLWEMDHIVRAEVPLLGTVRCHRQIVDDLVAALEEIEASGLGPTIDPKGYAGCWYPRRISTESSNLSSHSWGISLDINVDLDLPGLGPPPDPEVVAIFGRHGFRWGGHFLTPDNHHFEWVGGQVTAPPPRTDELRP